MRTRKAYTTDLSDREWCIIEPLLPAPKQRGRKITYRRLMLARLARKHQPQQQQLSQDCKTHSPLAAWFFYRL